MARVILEAGLRGISGMVGTFVYRLQADGSVTIARSPLRWPGRPRSAAQTAQNERFRRAALRYQELVRDPEVLAGYEAVMTRRSPMSRLRATVISDVLKPPEVQLLDVSRYHGRAGDVIRISGEDNVAVARMELVVFDLTGNAELERAERVYQGDKLRRMVYWEYISTVDAPDGHAVEACVRVWDLAGNEGEKRDSIVVWGEAGMETALCPPAAADEQVTDPQLTRLRDVTVTGPATEPVDGSDKPARHSGKGSRFVRLLEGGP